MKLSEYVAGYFDQRKRRRALNLHIGDKVIAFNGCSHYLLRPEKIALSKELVQLVNQ